VSDSSDDILSGSGTPHSPFEPPVTDLNPPPDPPAAHGPPPSDPAIAVRNIRAFVWFRVLFNSRFYYPVYGILFLDYGLTSEQFAILGAAWFWSIVIFDVPSGALADKLGRKRLVVFSAIVMVLEMLLLCFTPVKGGTVTFSLFLVNRVISALAESCCNGADEALVYDVLPTEGRAAAWTRVLASMMFWQSVTFMMVALIGAASYSDEFMNKYVVDAFFPGAAHLSKESCMRIPLWMNLIMALGTVVVSMRFVDTHPRLRSGSQLKNIIRSSVKQILGTGRWILRSPPATVLILTGMVYDSFIRLFYAIGAIYYRLLGIPKYLNGVILSGSSLIGLCTALVVEKLVGVIKPSQNFGLVAVLIVAGLYGVSLQINAWDGWAGILFVVPLWLAMRSLHYFLSQYLHSICDSSHRATVLSFKGLILNFANGLLMWFYGMQTAWLRQNHASETANASKEAADGTLLSLAMPWWPWIFGTLALLLVFFVRARYRKGLTTLIADMKAAVAEN
jgi:MFS family permease